MTIIIFHDLLWINGYRVLSIEDPPGMNVWCYPAVGLAAGAETL